MTKKKETNKGTRLVCQNKKAYHDYEIVETLEAGMVLLGTEVKSMREGQGIDIRQFQPAERDAGKIFKYMMTKTSGRSEGAEAQ